MVNSENYEEYLVLHADGELDEAETAALMAFIAGHPELKAELDAYESTRLVPDESLVFGPKASLLKEVPARKTISLKGWWAYGAAAGLLLVAGIGILRQTGQRTATGISAMAAATADLHRPEPVPLPAVTPANAVAQAPATPIRKEEVKTTTVPSTVAPVTGDIQLAQLTPRPAQSIPQPAMAEAPSAPELIFASAAAPADREGDLLALAEKKEALSLLGDAAAEQIDKVKKIRNSIKGTELAVTIGSRELFTLHF